MWICRDCSRVFEDQLDRCPDDGAPLVHVEQPESDPLLGRTLDGRFVLQSVLGRGAMGVVYLARQLSVDRPVAVKVLRREFSSDRILVARFLREAKALSLLHHPNLLTIFDFGQDLDGRLYVATELLEGVSVARSVRDEGPFASDAVVEVMRQVAEGLVVAHDKGIVHRDLKPENLFLVALSRGRTLVKVLDFGIAQVESGRGSARLTHVGGTMGTPAYMSPEQIRGQEVDPSSDIYSLGCVAYRLLTGEVPFTGASVLEIVQAHLANRPVPPAERCSCEQDLSDLLMRMLEKDPGRRFANAEALLDELESRALAPFSRPIIRPAGPTGATPAGIPSTRPGPEPGSSKEEAAVAGTHADPVSGSETLPQSEAEADPAADPAPQAQALVETLLEAPASTPRGSSAASDPDMPTDLQASVANEDTQLNLGATGRPLSLLLPVGLLVAAGALAWVLLDETPDGTRAPVVSQTVSGAPAATLTLESEPPGATVLRLGPGGDNVELGRTPLRVTVGAVVRLEKAGYLPAARELTGHPNETVRVELKPYEIPPP